MTPSPFLPPMPGPLARRRRALALALALAGALALPAAAQEGGADTPALWSVSPDGALVLDHRARLAWPRCVEGMQWTGRTCAGTPRLFTYGEAQALVRERGRADGVRWRLPRVNELRRLLDRKAQPATLDAALFPAAPPGWHWTGTASVNTATVNPYAYGNVARGGAGESQLSVQQGWAVDMASGEARGDVGRATRLPVRLVRPAP